MAGQQCRFDQLLRQRRRPFDGVTGLDIFDQRPENRFGIDAVMLEKAGVFDGHQSFDDPTRNLFIRDVEAILPFEDVGDETTVSVENLSRLFGMVMHQRLDAVADLKVEPDQIAAAPQRRQHPQPKEPFEESANHFRNSRLAKLASIRARV